MSSGFPFHLRDSHFTGVKPLKMFPSVFDSKVRVFARRSQRWWNSLAMKPSLLPRHSTLKRFARNSSESAGNSAMISEFHLCVLFLRQRSSS
jgi:hypothetical protein